MGNRVYLELRSSDLPHLAEEDEEAVVGLTANNGLPLFWFALLREEHIGGTWEQAFRTAFAEPEEHAAEPIRLGWREARADLAAACQLAEARLPGLAPVLRAWEAGIVLGAAWLCATLFGPSGMWAGGGLAFLAGCIALWRWAKVSPL